MLYRGCNMTGFIDYNGLKYFWGKISVIINDRINDAITKGLHSCASCGAPYQGKAICEYCGRGFFVDKSMYHFPEDNK